MGTPRAEPSDGVSLARIERAIRTSLALREDLQVLCDRIGPRMAGTEGMREALAWAEASFDAAGLFAVRLEPVPMPLRWEEGATSVEVLAPVGVSLRAVSSALSPPVPAELTAVLADGGSGQPGDISRRANRIAGKVALIRLDAAASFDELAVEQRDAMVAMGEAADAGALAVLFLSTRSHRLLYRHVNNVAGRIDPSPSALVAREDGLRLLRLLEAGEEVRVRLRMPNRIGPPYQTANVVAEIPGAAHAEEVVLLGAHLDSWDLGTGCLDNAVGAALVMHVARSLVRVGTQPRRTIRFVLFGGEEFGLFGSRAYVDRHRSELDRHVATIVHDMGDGPLIGYSVGGRDELLPVLERALGPAEHAGKYRHTTDPFFLSDNFTFMLHGVPSLFAVQDTSEFARTYHSEADTFDKVRIDRVTDAAAAAASAVLGIADLEARFGQQWDQRRVMAWLNRTGMVRHLRFLGVWDAWRPRPLPRGRGE